MNEESKEQASERRTTENSLIILCKKMGAGHTGQAKRFDDLQFLGNCLEGLLICKKYQNA